MSLKKEFTEEKAVCKVTFSLPKELVNSASKVQLLGDFNNWDTTKNTMRKSKNGSFSTSVSLKTGKEYQFRYLIDGEKWINDMNADKYVKSNLGHSENSVIVL